MARTPKEKAIDYLLTIYLINDAFSRRNLTRLYETKLQKLVFLSEKSMIDEREKGFNFYFIKLDYGPFSPELRNSLSDLIQTGFLTEKLKPKGGARLVLEDFRDVIERNRTFFQKIDGINESFARMPLRKLLGIIYSMPWGRRGTRTIADLSPRTPMLYPMKPHKVKIEFEITDEEIEDLLMNVDLEAIKALSQAMKELKSRRLLTRERVLSDL